MEMNILLAAIRITQGLEKYFLQHQPSEIEHRPALSVQCWQAKNMMPFLKALPKIIYGNLVCVA